MGSLTHVRGQMGVFRTNYGFCDTVFFHLAQPVGSHPKGRSYLISQTYFPAIHPPPSPPSSSPCPFRDRLDIWVLVRPRGKDSLRSKRDGADSRTQIGQEAAKGLDFRLDSMGHEKDPESAPQCTAPPYPPRCSLTSRSKGSRSGGWCLCSLRTFLRWRRRTSGHSAQVG